MYKNDYHSNRISMIRSALFLTLLSPLLITAGGDSKNFTQDPIIGFIILDLTKVEVQKPITKDFYYSDQKELLHKLSEYQPSIDTKHIVPIREFTADDELKNILNFKDLCRKQRAFVKDYDAISYEMHQELKQTIIQKNIPIKHCPLVRSTPDYRLFFDGKNNTDYFRNITQTDSVDPDIATLIPQEKLNKLIAIEKQMSQQVAAMNIFMQTKAYKKAEMRGRKKTVTHNNYEHPRAITEKDLRF